MNIIFESKLELPAGVSGPDAYDSANGLFPSMDFIVSRTREGLPASTMGDLNWDFNAYRYSAVARGRFNFVYWGKQQIDDGKLSRSLEMRFVMFALIWKREGNPLAVGTLNNYMSVLCALAQYADEMEGSLHDVMGESKSLIHFVGTRCSGWMAETLASLLSILAPIGKAALGFNLVGEKCIQHIKSLNRGYRGGLKQHPPIPTRIFSQFLSGLQSELDEWLMVAKEMLSAFSACSADPRIGRCSARHTSIAKQHALPAAVMLDFEELLSARCRKYLLAKGKTLNVIGMCAVIGDIQGLCKLTILAYTGMRDDEGSTLPYRCISASFSNGKKHYLVEGMTTKFNEGRPKRTSWVTSVEAHKAIRAAQAIADSIYAATDVSPTRRTSRIEDYPLFVSTRYMHIVSVPLTPIGGRFVPGQQDHRELPDHAVASIADADLLELEHIDPHRAWRSEARFQIGQPWYFTNHQLRRSLALYAQRSGLVSLPSLRRQLQHLTEEMSRYYARGSAFAKNFIGDDPQHFGREWQSTQPESSGLSYIANVLFTDDALFGGHAHWVAHRVSGQGAQMFADREVTLKRFKKGELAYRETLIGGCTNIGTCDKVAVSWLHVECLRDNCKNLVGNVTKLERVIAAQQRLVDSIDTTTVEFTVETEDLGILIKSRQLANVGQNRS